MKVGTKSVLFGVHQFIVHPYFVARAWSRVYGHPTLRELICIVVHDLGYFGKPNMDGTEGKTHPNLGGRMAKWLLGHRYGDLARFHSRSYAELNGASVSRLALPDKLAIFLYPVWLYLLLGRLSGEIKEYKVIMNLVGLDDRAWLIETRSQTMRWAVASADDFHVHRELLRDFEARLVNGGVKLPPGPTFPDSKDAVSEYSN